MKGEENLYQLRVGDVRLLFELNEKTSTITLVCVTEADSRGQIYKRKIDSLMVCESSQGIYFFMFLIFDTQKKR